MTDATTTDTTTTTTAATTTAADPWHKGLDAEIIGHAQNKGWKLDDPKEAFVGAVKQARELEKHFGVPADQLLKMPKADAKPEDHKAFWAKLGAGEAKDYDLSSVKLNGQPLDAALADAMRGAMAEAFVPKDKAIVIADKIVKQLESSETAKATVAKAKIDEERLTLERSWGGKESATWNFNLLKAMEGARRLGPAFVTALENAKDSPGYAAIMEGMRKIGVGTSEDTFVERGAGGGTGVTTREGAVARKAELMADQAWAGRYLAGGKPERQEMDGLNMMIDGERAA